IAGIMNTAVGGQFIFAGTAIDTPPVDASQMPTTVTLGVADNSYYQGNSQPVKATVQDGVVIDANITGDAQAFQDLMAGIATAKTGDAGNDMGTLEDAYTLIQHAVSGLIALQGQVGSTQTTVTNANNFLNSQKTYLQTLHDNLIGADLISLSTM